MPAAARPMPAAPSPAVDGVGRPASPPPPVVAEPAGSRQAPHLVDPSPGPVQAAAEGLSCETRRAPVLPVTGGTPPAVSGAHELHSALPDPREALTDTRAAATDSSVIVAAAGAGERVPRECPGPPEPAAGSSSGPAAGSGALYAEPVLPTGRADASVPADRAQVAVGPPERPRMAAHSETTRPPSPEPRPAPRMIELPPELSLQLARITAPAGAGPVLRPGGRVRKESPVGPVRSEVPVPGESPVESVRAESRVGSVGPVVPV
ncbi:hypothetical protein, partial [Nocardia sienata]|uniref:hypothetical protein n=1 Tax=Nocardia sienata TaxID=248552 RepID=UPI003F75748C